MNSQLADLLAKPRKTRKYRNQPVEIDGVRFDSKGEAARWQELRLLERGGLISDLRRQVTFRLDVNGVHVCRYVADFVYLESGQTVVEDFKSDATVTPDFKLKRRLMLAVHGIDVRLVKK